MTKDELMSLRIPSVNQEIYFTIRENMDHVAKPLDGLGVFEHLIAQIGAIQKSTQPDIRKKAVIVMCGDNGVVEEGISQSGKEVTLAVAKAMGKNMSSVGKMAAAIGAKVIPLDIGINSSEEIPGVMNKKVALGTKNFRKEAAMTEEEALHAIEEGMQLVRWRKKEGDGILATGEMGIGNTTTSTAIAAAILDMDVTAVTGRGAGLNDLALARKIQVIDEAINKYQLRKADPFTVLQTVGGLDIAGLTGVFLGAALYEMPVLIDGVISAVAALLAEEFCPGAKKYMIASHRSRETIADVIMDKMDLKPVIDADMALGEGTGAVMMMSLLDISIRVYLNGFTFDALAIDEYERYS